MGHATFSPASGTIHYGRPQCQRYLCEFMLNSSRGIRKADQRQTDLEQRHATGEKAQRIKILYHMLMSTINYTCRNRQTTQPVQVEQSLSLASLKLVQGLKYLNSHLTRPVQLLLSLNIQSSSNRDLFWTLNMKLFLKQTNHPFGGKSTTFHPGRAVVCATGDRNLFQVQFSFPSELQSAPLFRCCLQNALSHRVGIPYSTTFNQETHVRAKVVQEWSQNHGIHWLYHNLALKKQLVLQITRITF